MKLDSEQQREALLNILRVAPIQGPFVQSRELVFQLIGLEKLILEADIQKPETKDI